MEEEKYQQYVNWQKERGQVSSSQYLSFMKVIENTLLVKDFHKIKSVSVLKLLLKQLETNKAFCARGKSDRDNILSGFRNYIEFIKSLSS